MADDGSSMMFRGLSQTHHGCAGEAVGAAVTERSSHVDDGGGWMFDRWMMKADDSLTGG